MKKMVATALVCVCLVCTAISTYAQSPEPDSVADILKEIKHQAKGSKERHRLLGLLEKVPKSEQDRDRLVQALDDEDLDVQDVAIRVFWSTKDKKAVPRLLEKVKGISYSAQLNSPVCAWIN